MFRTDEANTEIKSNFICPKSLNYSIYGNLFSSSSKGIHVIIKQCKGAGCQSATEISNALTKNRFRVALINSYFDFNDFQSPVKYYIDDSVFVRTASGFYNIIQTKSFQFCKIYNK